MGDTSIRIILLCYLPPWQYLAICVFVCLQGTDSIAYFNLGHYHLQACWKCHCCCTCCQYLSVTMYQCIYLTTNFKIVLMVFSTLLIIALPPYVEVLHCALCNVHDGNKPNHCHCLTHCSDSSKVYLNQYTNNGRDILSTVRICCLFVNSDVFKTRAM